MISSLNIKIKKKQLKIAVIGLGYVGLPIAKAFSKHFKVIGYDINKGRISDLKNKIDSNDLNKKIKKKFSKNLIFSNKKNFIKNCDVFIITVPTPVNKRNIPNLKFLDNAINDLISFDLKGKFIVVESTVFPTLCAKYIKLIQFKKKIQIDKDFYFGFSPERINPSDNFYTIKNIDKIVSSSSKKSVNFLKKLYSKIINKTHISYSIEDAEMAKIIENTQRDINIAFINEISIICNKLNLNFKNVIRLASTKWNFLKFKPGLVGGHCISVDPYYLTHILKEVNYKPKVILSGRDINENYHKNLVSFFGKNLKSKKIKILISGLTYKEDCNDVRNSKAFNLSTLLKKKYSQVHLYDPNLKEKKFYNQIILDKPMKNFYDLIVICVRHRIFFKKSKLLLKKFGKKNCKYYDIKLGGFLN
jgi:UDP-N-acetyl-D-galactosamine dehydrogenase